MSDSPDKLETATVENKPRVKMGFKFWLTVGLFYLSLLLMLIIVLVVLVVKS